MKYWDENFVHMWTIGVLFKIGAWKESRLLTDWWYDEECFIDVMFLIFFNIYNLYLKIKMIIKTEN
jgi:hypothetical protein